MKRFETALPGIYVLEPEVFSDPRGYFFESYHQARFAELGIQDQFVQDNHSSSARNVLRGLHYQVNAPQAKLCRVAEGEVFDVAVDVRLGSPTFGKWIGVLLSAERHNLIYIPAGFAHGFLARSDNVQFLYKCSSYYDPSDDRGIIWNDPTLNIDWKIRSPLLSNKDQDLPRLAEVPPAQLPRFEAR
jgi:dTDP-4-dehydrorhamnose 3,5-epimerase